MKQRKFEVWRSDRCLDIVYADEDITAASMRESLIRHDRYPSDISVYRMNERGVAYDDCCRATHPEEWHGHR